MVITKRKEIIAYMLILFSAVFALVLESWTSKGPLKSLELRWKISLDNQVEKCKADEGIVYFQGYDSNIYAVNAKTGDDVWMKQSERCVDARYGLLYCWGAQGVFRAYAKRDGKEVWKCEIKGDYYSPVICKGIVYFTSDCNKPFALNAMTGEEISLSAELSGEYLIIADDNMYFFHYRYDRYIQAIDENTFAEKWRYYMNSSLTSFEAVSWGKAFFSDGGSFYAIDAETGNQIWEVKMKSGEVTGTAVGENAVYCGNSNGTVYAFDIYTGREKWKSEVKGYARFCRPVFYEGYVYYATNMGILYAIDAQTGAKSAIFKIAKGEIAPLEISDGFIYFGGYSQMQRVGDYGEVYGVEIVR
ncbi:MAG: PQQ-binding-like beta-propeller repeat protein [Planctomycetes bacterium]|nr:PQQ-binding-like beta-propeller repeat protein [Planctomycetota bacterium]